MLLRAVFLFFLRVKKQLLYTLICIIVSASAVAQSGELQRLYVQALQAHQQGNDAEFYQLIMQAHAIHPYHPGILYQAGMAAALTGKKTEAVQYLKEAIMAQADFVLLVPELNTLKGLPEFEHVKKLKDDLNKPVIVSDTAFTINDRSLHAEAIAPGLHDQEFFITSVHKRKIIRVENGVAQDYTLQGQDGMCAAFGLKVDRKSKLLWISSSPIPEMNNYDASLPSAVYCYDLMAGKLIHKYLPENPALELVLGDLIISKKGDVYTSDSKGNLIFRVNEANGKLEQFFSSEEFWNIQGITLSDDDQYMFIADYIKGLYRLDMQTMTLTSIKRHTEATVKGIDGLIYYDNSLIAIQNGVKPMRVTLFTLNKAQDAIISHTILDQSHPAFNEPTNGCLVGDSLYYIGNSQWGGYDNGKIKPHAELQDIVVLKRTLK